MSDKSISRGRKAKICEMASRTKIMIRLSIVLIGAWIMLTPVFATSSANPKWALKADYVDACSCDLTCPYLFGGSPT